MGKFISDFRSLRLAAAVGLALLAASPMTTADAMPLTKVHGSHAEPESVEKAGVDAGTLTSVRPRLYDRRLLVSVPGVDQADLAADIGNVSLTSQEISDEGGLIALRAIPEGGSTLADAENIHLSADVAGKIGISVNGELAKENTLNRSALQAENATVITTQRRVRELVGTVINSDGFQEADGLVRSQDGTVQLSAVRSSPLSKKTGKTTAPQQTAKSGAQQKGKDGAIIIEHLKQRGTPASAYKVAEADPDVILDAEAWVEGPG